jgi:hypothetical protein
MLGGPQKQFIDYMRAEGERWARVTKATGARAD